MDSHDSSKLQFEQRAVSPCGMLTLYLMNRSLIHVPEKNNDDASVMSKETEELDKQMIKRWLGEADSIIIFVCAGSTILCITIL